jgi:hypothetical protein
MGEMRNLYKNIVLRRRKEENNFGKAMRRWNYNNRIDHNEIG